MNDEEVKKLVEENSELMSDLVELEDLEKALTQEEKTEIQVEDDSLKVEFDKAVKESAEERARSPFLAAAQMHAMIYQGFEDSVTNLSGGAAKRILKYLCGYPFYIKDLNAQDKNVEAVAYRASKLIEAKSAMILCKAIEQEARVAKALDEQEALIVPLNLEQPIEKETADSTVEIKGE